MAGSESLIRLQMRGFPTTVISIPLPPLCPCFSHSLPPGAAAAVGVLRSTAGDSKLGGSLVVLRSDTWRQKEKGKCQGVTLLGPGDPSVGEAQAAGGAQAGCQLFLCLPFPPPRSKSSWGLSGCSSGACMASHTQGWPSRAKGHPRTALPSPPHHVVAKKCCFATKHRRGPPGIVSELGGSADPLPASGAPVRSPWGFPTLCPVP